MKAGCRRGRWSLTKVRLSRILRLTTSLTRATSKPTTAVNEIMLVPIAKVGVSHCSAMSQAVTSLGLNGYKYK
jgi:hypothetical protein